MGGRISSSSRRTGLKIVAVMRTDLDSVTTDAEAEGPRQSRTITAPERTRALEWDAAVLGDISQELGHRAIF